jgi:hypothetical protein
MSYLSTALIQCEDLQEKIIDVWTNKTFPNDPIPFLEYLTSPANRRQIVDIVNTGRGKTRTLNVTYFQRLAESTVEDASSRDCAATDKIGNCETTYEMDTTDLKKSSELIEAADLERFCQDNPTYIAERILHHMDVIDRSVASKSSSEAAAVLGGWSDDAEANYTVTADKLVVETKDSSGNLRAGTWEEIYSAASMSGFNGFVGFGGNLLREYMALTQSGCCADQGIDIGNIMNRYGFAFAYDRRLANALGSTSTQNLIMEPGALQLFDYVQTPWKDGIDFNAGYYAQAMTTPAGVNVDVYVKDECPGTLKLAVYANTMVKGLPTDLYATGDNFSGVTYAAGVTVTNP